MEKKEKEEIIRWLRDRDAGMLLLGIAHLGKMVEFMNSDTSELDKNIKKSTDTLVDYVLGKLDKAREEGRKEYARELLDDYYDAESDSITIDILEIQKELSKLK